eukprot:Plantae.Rhodophyta-Purpureofilum_apyrenoidigerum.ctg11260.p1 GENE.Plantae.Rhodophyta-Purpureofilum_apyrenoidigerum.ctg11260~~Plantae.Rhodophyta-Purpureofilum_apyrenoidigerum.ctg11260.p1  ORF type:complete len:253 (+),score=52.19 Plantae.Rhodophyta-Purpureofilum_apyrenoidigerum.ctg11260:99-761(+)
MGLHENVHVGVTAFVGQIASSASPSAQRRLATCSVEAQPEADLNVPRRRVLQLAGAIVSTMSISEAVAAMYDYSVKGGTSSIPKNGSVDQYLPQIKAGYQALLEMQSNWFDYTKDFDGDKVRRVLGTVGVKSPLFNIKKAFEGAWNALKTEDVDVDFLEEAQEDFDEVLNQISQVDFQLYSVNFTELRETKQNLVDQGKHTLDNMLVRYKTFIEKLEASL